MGKDDLEEFLDLRSVMRHSIKFLNVNGEQLIDEAFNHIKSLDKPYSDDLDEVNNQDFKKTILEGHFQWITDHCNEFSTKFDKKYKQNIDINLLTAYRDAFSYMLTMLPNMQIRREEVEGNIEDHLNFLIKNT